MADTLKDRIRTDLVEARRGRDRLRTMVLTTVLSEIRNKEIELGRDATDEDVIGVLTRSIKQRAEAAEQMRGAGREELAEKEEREAELLDAYTPESMGEDEVRAIVREAIAGGADNMGAVMGQLMPRIKGRFDGREANRIVREELG
ncbi:MAG: GatB/YqeY domain-containing protein [Gemmatimonadota bacterium]